MLAIRYAISDYAATLPLPLLRQLSLTYGRLFTPPSLPLLLTTLLPPPFRHGRHIVGLFTPLPTATMKTPPTPAAAIRQPRRRQYAIDDTSYHDTPSVEPPPRHGWLSPSGIRGRRGCWRRPSPRHHIDIISSAIKLNTITKATSPRPPDSREHRLRWLTPPRRRQHQKACEKATTRPPLLRYILSPQYWQKHVTPIATTTDVTTFPATPVASPFTSLLPP